jgi:hypothetical protein
VKFLVFCVVLCRVNFSVICQAASCFFIFWLYLVCFPDCKSGTLSEKVWNVWLYVALASVYIIGFFIVACRHHLREFTTRPIVMSDIIGRLNFYNSIGSKWTPNVRDGS